MLESAHGSRPLLAYLQVLLILAKMSDLGRLLAVQEISRSLLPAVQRIFGNQLKVPRQAKTLWSPELRPGPPATVTLE